MEEVAESPAGQQVINAGGAAITSVIIAASGAVPKLAEAGGHLLEKIGGQETVACNECNQWTYQSKWSKAEGGAKGAQATDEKTKGSGDAVKKGQEDTRQKPQDQPNRKAAKEAFNREAGSNSRKPIRDRNTGKLKGVGAGKASYRPKGRDRYSVTPKSGKAKDTLHFP
ncbi:MAG: hypothetical protein QOF62_912 [Pyrinomonadaceae bacterium]|nr:hypothetical protein [Pyrinomonadaceae bacterium]